MRLSQQNFIINFEFVKKKVNLFFFLAGILINIGTWLILFLKIKPQSAPIFLHYNIYFGVDLIGPWYRIYYLSAVGLLLLLVNFVLISLIDKKSEIVGYFLSGITFFLESAILFTSWLIVRQNI